VAHGEGIIKVTGEVGSGKTMLCRMLESLLPENVVVIYLVNPSLGREEVVYAIAGELGLATGGQRPDEVIRNLQSDLIAKHAAGKQVVLLIEEAQAMPLDTLEEIRLFSNLETSHHKLLQIVLFGQPELDANLRLPRMRQLKERITHSFKVPPMEPDLSPEFLMFRMRTAGYRGPDIFSAPAIKLISTVSEGIVRRISILADKSLLAAFADNTHAIEAKHVKAAIDDSEFADTAAAKKRRKIAWAALAVVGSAGIVAALAFAWISFSHQLKDHARANHATPAPVNSVASANSNTLASAPPAQAVQPAQSTVEQRIAAPPAGQNKSNNGDALLTTQGSASNVTQSDGDILDKTLSDSKAWLASENPKHFSVQLALLDAANRSQITQYLKQVAAEIGNDPVHLYPTKVGGVARFGVLYGTYGTHDEAAKIRTEISHKPGRQPPQIRSIQGIRGEISKSHSDHMWP
jgi:type II secretory pathway predicted ATPase ExeA